MERLSRIPYFGSQLLLIYMPLHIFLSQSLSLVTGGLEAWKIAKDVVLGLLVLFTICLVFWQGKAGRFFRVLVAVTVAYGLVHLVIWAANPDIYQRTAILGTVYNMRLPLFAILGAGAVLLLPKFVFSSLIRLVLGVSTLVAFLGIVQYFLPSDVLTHVGYGLERGARAAFFIDDNPLFLRIMSTLREPNALAAYLLLPGTFLALLFYRVKDARRYLIGGALGLHLIAILLTQSRSAWLALIVALSLALAWMHKTWLIAVLKKYWWIWVSLAIIACTATPLIKDTHFFQSYIVHSDASETTQDLDSNDYHWLLVRQGIEGFIDKPLGHGPGTAGIVSIQNPSGGQLTENYYVQIAYELGVVGIGLFIVINIFIYRYLWQRRDYIGIALCTSFWAYFVTNMLLHTWSNEAVAAQWWILAGMLAVTGVSDNMPPKRS